MMINSSEVVPVNNEEKLILESYKRLKSVIEKLMRHAN